MSNDVIREPFEPVVVDAGVVKDDLFMRESVKTADVWMRAGLLVAGGGFRLPGDHRTF